MPLDSKGSEDDAELLLDLVCHDINNMNQILSGYLELAQKSISPDNVARGYIDKCMAIIADSARLLQSAQKLRRVSSGIWTQEEIEIGRVLSEAIGQYASVSGTDVTIDYVQASGCVVIANELLKDAFLNIIGNAIKHATGPPVIHIRVEQTSEGGKGFCLVSIDDNGPGIPDDIKAKLFERREPGQASSCGSGLGLYLVRRLVEGFDGQVWVEDRVPGDFRKGSRFVVALPMADQCPEGSRQEAT